MSRPVLAITAILLAGGLFQGWTALGQVTEPFMRIPAGVSVIKADGTLVPAVAQQPARKSGRAARKQTSVAKLVPPMNMDFRPVDRFESVDFDEAERMLSRKTFIEEVYDEDMQRNFINQYRSEVEPFEKTANNPLRRARSWEMKDYDNKRAEMAKWASREILNDQIKDFFRKGDKNSAPMQVMGTLKDLSNGGKEDPAEQKLTPEEKAARAHRHDLPQVTKAEEEKIPTKFKTKLNVLRRSGTLLFTNPIVTTAINLKAGNRDDNMVVEMNREFTKLTLNSRLKYEVDRSLMNFNLNKRITDRISLDMNHMQFTGSKRGDNGEKRSDTAKLLYSVGF